MKSFGLVLLAMMLGVSSLLGQGNQAPESVRPAPNAPQNGAVTPVDNRATPPAAAAAAKPRKPDASYIPAAGGKGQAETLFELIRHGGWTMIPLGVMSVLAVMLTLYYLATLRRGAILTPHYMNTADVLLKKRDYLGLLAISSRHSEAVARVVQRTLDFATKNPGATFEVLRDVAETEGSRQAASLQHRVTYLADIGTLAPMVGLFGTVVGIVKSFGELGSGPNAANRDWGLAAGVSEALVATGGGLVIGILAFTFYAFFRNRVQRLISDLEVASAHVIGLMAINFKKREPSRAAVDDEY